MLDKNKKTQIINIYNKATPDRPGVSSSFSTEETAIGFDVETKADRARFTARH